MPLKHPPFKKITKTVSFTIIAALLAVGIFYLGTLFATEERRVLITDRNELIKGDFSLFWEAVDLIRDRYVYANDLQDHDLLYGAIRGVLDTLGDPYAGFFTPEDAEKFEQDLSGSFGGIGAEIGIRNSQLIVVAPLKGNPAEEVGLKAGDSIVEINGEETHGLAIEEAVKRIRGEPGTVVTLLIFREGWDDAKEFEITRAIVNIPTVDWEMGNDKILYMQIYNFNGNMPPAFESASLQALYSGVRGIVLDVRNNPGGFLDVATYIEGWFLYRGEIAVIEQFASGEEQVIRAVGNEALAHLPVVVLVNRGSASASEIVAGALRDLKGAKLIGEKTYGKGSVQEVSSLSDGSSVKVSIAAWLTPNGNKIDGIGLEPDIPVELTDEDFEAGRDPQKEKAFEVMRALLSQ